MILKTGVVLISFFVLAGCDRAPGIPKPRAYPKIEYPERTYASYEKADCPFSFEYPGYAELTMKPEHPCWFDLFMPAFNARIHCSYVPVHSRTEFDEVVRDVYIIADKINARANYMEEARIGNPHGVHGLTLRWTGPAASPFHFFLTDTTQHFFRAALYFEAEVRPDSLAPIVMFLEEDIQHLIQSFTWQ
jgi:gliding motility-associated lipoprotein GldD